ncbi:MAG: hypothetical protein PF486_00260 [Prolixibacteraceae bacterium]|jgi:preprotein translocase subunit YajC|nr:hypothetical protein [Prolixibacteraceae bacterium]
MNKILIIILLPFWFILSDKTEPEKKELQTENSLSLNDFVNTFGGVWLPEKYVNKIKESNSAYLSKNLILQISELTIHKRNLKNDTLFVGSSLNNHEGFGFNIWNTEHQIGCTFSNNIFEREKEKKYHFTYDLFKKSISIICKNNDGKVESHVDYIKVLEPEFISNRGGGGYEIISRTFTINGKYQILDSLKNDLGIVSFEPETGQIQNFQYEYYAIDTDFIGPLYSSDYILFRLKPEKYSAHEYLSVINKNDTILLYDNMEVMTDSTYDIELKNIKYYLINKNY